MTDFICPQAIGGSIKTHHLGWALLFVRRPLLSLFHILVEELERARDRGIELGRDIMIVPGV